MPRPASRPQIAHRSPPPPIPLEFAHEIAGSCPLHVKTGVTDQLWSGYVDLFPVTLSEAKGLHSSAGRGFFASLRMTRPQSRLYRADPYHFITDRLQTGPEMPCARCIALLSSGPKQETRFLGENGFLAEDDFRR